MTEQDCRIAVKLKEEEMEQKLAKLNSDLVKQCAVSLGYETNLKSLQTLWTAAQHEWNARELGYKQKIKELEEANDRMEAMLNANNKR